MKDIPKGSSISFSEENPKGMNTFEKKNRNKSQSVLSLMLLEGTLT